MAHVQSISPPRVYPQAMLGVAVVGSAVGLICIRMALGSGVPAMIIIGVRIAIAVALFTPFVLLNYGHILRQLRRRDWLLLALAGILFAGDLSLFSESLRHTSILLAGVIGGLAPLWTALLERFILKTRLHRLVYIGLTLAVAGGVMIAISGSTGSPSLGENPLLGGALALTSGLSAASYLTVARSLRPRIPLVPYIWLVFSFALGAVLLAALLTGTSFTGYAPEGYFWVLMATIVSQLIAHPSFSFVVGYLSPTFISISGQSITVLASVAAFFIFQEVPGPGEIIASMVILLGVVFAIKGQGKVKTA